jgi:hypothetical protein
MKARTRFLRFVSGFAICLVVLIAGFSIVRAAIPTWGATKAEQIQALPGDEVLPKAPSAWVNAVTINAAPETVWPWLIQMGDSRGGFYSFMFIERTFMRAFGFNSGEVQAYYQNADRIHPEWQNPPQGQGMIMDYVAVREYEPGRYLLASATEKFAGMGWTWLWHITPTADGRTRLVVHLRTQPPAAEQPNPVMDAVVGAVVDLGGFVMEKNMIDGIKLRAEGGSEPNWAEIVEIVLWLAALGLGIAAAVRYIARRAWRLPLALGLAAIVLLLVFTYLQPALWLRAVADLLLLGGVVYSAKAK